MTKAFQARQGDVLIDARNHNGKTPKAAEEVKREQGRVVLAHGEATGHHHSFRDNGVRLFRDSVGGYLQVDGPESKPLVHQEHTAIPIPPGNYKVTRQREWKAGMARRVAD